MFCLIYKRPDLNFIISSLNLVYLDGKGKVDTSYPKKFNHIFVILTHIIYVYNIFCCGFRIFCVVL